MVTKINKSQAKENLIATLQTIAANKFIRAEFSSDISSNFFSWNQNLVASEKEILLPEFELKNQVESEFTQPTFWQENRAAADLVACYLLAHDKKLASQKFREPQEQKFFDEFEKIRVIAEVQNSYLGVVKNILRKIESDIFSGSTSLSLLLLKEIFAEKILPRTQEFAFDVEKNLSKKVADEIKKLAKITANQSDFELGVERVLELLKNEDDSQKEEDEEENSSPDQQQNNSDEVNDSGTEKLESEVNNFGEEDEEVAEKPVEKEEKIADFKEDDVAGKSTIKVDEQGFLEDKLQFKNPYKVYTTKFDEVIFPQKLVAKNDLESLRDQLDLKLAKLSGVSQKMSLHLKKKLLSKKNSFLESQSALGVLDRKKLARIVTNPISDDIWIAQKNHQYQDTCLTILLDNSGSMRGNPIVMSALACEIIAEILEKFSIKTEIIGFTTADWKGGRARKLWEISGRAQNPGRLNELRHIVYKHFNQSFKKSKTNLGLMLKEGILKENIDGEALLFARSRLMQRSEKRKILMVISDGTPVDDSTVLANDSDILTDHLHRVINKIEQRGDIEIVGVGIGHSTDDFYRNSLAIKSLEELGDGMIKKISELLG